MSRSESILEVRCWVLLMQQEFCEPEFRYELDKEFISINHVNEFLDELEKTIVSHKYITDEMLEIETETCKFSLMIS